MHHTIASPWLCNLLLHYQLSPSSYNGVSQVMIRGRQNGYCLPYGGNICSPGDASAAQRAPSVQEFVV